MSSNKQEYFGEDYLVEIADDAVEVWQILAKEHKGGYSWHYQLTFQERRSLPLSPKDARNFVTEFISEINREAGQSVIDTLSGHP